MSRTRPITGRGTQINPDNRFQTLISSTDITDESETGPLPETEYIDQNSRSIVTKNNSPDVPFNLSVNPYQGCEHGCVYCFARPTHEYLDLSSGLDFETKIHYKSNAADQLRHFLSKPGYQCEPITLGANTDPYQQAERKLQITRQILEVMSQFNQPVAIITKGSSILRDLDILKPMADKQLVNVMISVTTLDTRLKNLLEPRAAAPVTRIKIIETLANEGIPVGTLIAPVIPAINDNEMEKIIRICSESGAAQIGYVLLRLPHQLKTLFNTWLTDHFPARKNKILHILEQCHDGRSYRSEFGIRQRGTGPYAELLARRFEIACAKNGVKIRSDLSLRTDLFQVPGTSSQLDLF